MISFDGDRLCVHAVAASYLCIVGLAYVFIAPNTLISAFQSTGQPQFPLLASGARLVVVVVGGWIAFQIGGATPAGLGIVTANELHIPISDPAKPTPTYLSMSSADVSHSFWVPRLAGKMDVIPNRLNIMWMDPAQAGLYLGQCAQYCGTEHAKMLLRVYAQSPEDFAAWISQQKKPAQQDFPGNPAATEGQTVFMHNACINCHAVSGTAATGRFGPDLTHLASRDTIASGPIENTPENLRKWVDNPNTMKPGSLMPAMHLNDHDLDVITAYLTQLH